MYVYVCKYTVNLKLDMGAEYMVFMDAHNFFNYICSYWAVHAGQRTNNIINYLLCLYGIDNHGL